jgi:hypothetical protein
MADIEELLGQLQNPGDDGVPDTIYDDIRAAHTGALEATQSTAQAKIDELVAAHEATQAEVNRLKAANWDLFEQIPKAGDETPGDDTEETIHDQQTLDDLIVDEETS